MKSIFGIFAAAILFVLISLPMELFAQGESAVPFLLIAPNSRSGAMGESGAGLADDAAAIFWNPAGLAFQQGQEISITHANWLPQFQQSDLFYDFLTYRKSVESLNGTVAASVTYLNLGEFIRTLDSPAELGRFKAYEFALTTGYATKISEQLGIGVSLRFIRSQLSPIGTAQEQGRGVATSLSFDVATLYRWTDRFSVGASLSNMGPKIFYIDAAQADPLPTNLRVGLGYKILVSEYNNLTASLDLSRLLVRRYSADSLGNAKPPDPFYKAIFTAWGDNGLKKVVMGGGLEYWYGNPKLVALRTGYFYESPSFGGRKFLTFGAGIRYDIYGFDFSYISAPEQSPLGNTIRFSLLISWGGPEH